MRQLLLKEMQFTDSFSLTTQMSHPYVLSPFFCLFSHVSYEIEEKSHFTLHTLADLARLMDTE